MDFMDLIILLIAFGVLEQVIKAVTGGKKSGDGGTTLPDAGPDEEDAGRPGGGLTVEDLIREELGVNLERTPTIEPSEPSWGSEERGEHTSEADRGHQARAATGPRVDRAADPDERRRRSRRTSRPDVEPPTDEEAHYLDEWRRGQERQPVSLEEIREREAYSLETIPDREAETLERPRTPETHRRFHERYGVPQPVSTHKEFHRRYIQPTTGSRTRRPRAARLPDRPNWTMVQKAFVWSEVFGPPKALDPDA